MSERRYKDVMNELNDKRESMVSEINALEDEMTNEKPITIEQYFDGTIQKAPTRNLRLLRRLRPDAPLSRQQSYRTYRYLADGQR